MHLPDRRLVRMKNIYLIGMPSSGKSTLGKRMADALHYHFLDTDRMIVRTEGRSIADIFSKDGEAYFREAERCVLRTIKPGQNLVVSTGGGMPCFHDNMDYIRVTGVSVFLDVPLHALLRRMLAHNGNDRPLYQPSDPDLADALQQKYNVRLPYYQQADITVSGEADAETVLHKVGTWL